MKPANHRFSFELEYADANELEVLNDTTAGRGEEATSNAGDWILSLERHRRRHRCTNNKAVFAFIFTILLGTSAYYSPLFFKREKTPPIAHREEGRVIYAGKAPPGWDPKIPRQSVESIHPLMDPTAIDDPYGWMRDESRSSQEVLQHLKDNNDYTQARTRHLENLTEILYNEMKSFMLETSHSFPSLNKDYYYYRRTMKGAPYPLHVRAPKPLSPADDGDSDQFHAEFLKKHLSLWDGSQSMPVLPNEVIYIDENQLTQGHDYFTIGSIEISSCIYSVSYR